ncbi:hypothetical protein VSR69_05175 [Paraburkholderia phytofirmans]|jgi:hypothetical protein|uniref:hypothetical protein n=1 Tax=Paraburkholderia sp. BL9I2N2 TaxID=1938809 RepID=UPI0010D846AF|nr:hypothetical protein [Paraburkholderia sp. BL9I2N2]TCK96624.1 hypothetical protein B0G74_3314 [Paraburkholderia sp. BL9I2N2]
MRRRYKSAVFADAIRSVWAILALLAAVASSSAEAREIKVVSGTYGKNCGASRGNATADLARQCNGLQTCRYVLHKAPAGTPSVRCRTDFRAEWSCTGTEFHTAALSAQAEPGSTLVLSCVEETGAGK